MHVTLLAPADDASACAFDTFVAARGGALLRTAFLLVPNAAAAEDLLQASLEKTWRNWSRLHDQSMPSAEAYTRRVMIALSLRLRRRRWNSEVPHGTLPERAETATSVDERPGLIEALRSLPPRWRAIIVLRYFEDLEERAVAELLGCSIGTVKSSSHRALARLRLHPRLAREPIDSFGQGLQ